MEILSEYIKEDNIHFPVKFTRSEYVDDILSGSLYMNNLQYFIDLEKTTNTKGQGDKMEGGHVFRPDKMTVMDPETGKIIFEGKGVEVIERRSNSTEIPIFCFTVFSTDDFELMDEADDWYYFHHRLSSAQVEEFKKLGDKAIMLPNRFIDNFINNAEKNGDYVEARKVQYFDYNLFSKERAEMFDKGTLDFLFWKEKSFEYQREMRFVLPNNLTDSNIRYQIDSIREESKVLETEDFFDNIAICIPKKDIASTH